MKSSTSTSTNRGRLNRMLPFSFTTLLAACLLMNPISAGNIITVEPGDNTLGPAVAGASAGDILQLKKGEYTVYKNSGYGFLINKTIEIRGA